MAQESDEHREWREEQEDGAARFERVSALAEQALLQHPDLNPRECVQRAQQLLVELDSVRPRHFPEPPFSDELPPTNPDPAPQAEPAGAVLVTPPARPPGFWPGSHRLEVAQPPQPPRG